MEYGRIIKRAWYVTWHNKILWVFGILAALFGGTSGSGNHGSARPQGAQVIMNMQNHGQWQGMPPYLGPGPWGGPPLGRLGMGMQEMLPAMLAIMGVLLIVGLILYVIGLVVRYTSYGSLIGMVDEIEESETTTFRSGLAKGWKRLLHLLATDLILGILTFVVTMVVLVAIGLVAALPLVPGIVMVSAGRGMIAVGVILIVLGALIGALLLLLYIMAISALTSLVRHYAFRASVLDQAGIIEGLTSSMRLIKSRARESVLMWLLMAVIELALGIVTIPLGLLALGGIVGPGAVMLASTGSVVAGILAALPGLLIVILVSSVIGGVYFVFRSAAWTLTFRELKSIEVLDK